MTQSIGKRKRHGNQDDNESVNSAKREIREISDKEDKSSRRRPQRQQRITVPMRLSQRSRTGRFRLVISTSMRAVKKFTQRELVASGSGTASGLYRATQHKEVLRTPDVQKAGQGQSGTSKDHLLTHLTMELYTPSL